MKAKLKKILFGILAAITSPTAVKQERSLAAFLVGRVVIAVGGSAAVAVIIEKLVHG